MLSACGKHIDAFDTRIITAAAQLGTFEHIEVLIPAESDGFAAVAPGFMYFPVESNKSSVMARLSRTSRPLSVITDCACERLPNDRPADQHHFF